jgi:hypothetical protein
VGTHTGTITISSSDASNSPQTVNVTLTIYAVLSDSGPFGGFETPVNHSTVMSSIPVTGWVLDDIGVERVTIWRDSVQGEGSGQVYIGDAILVEGARPDVQQQYPSYPMSYKAGWGYMMLTNFLPNGGNGTFKLHTYANDDSGHEVLLGTKTITCDNANAVKPFGAIATPRQGGEASGSSFRNQGWVLTPMPNKIPVDGSTITVYIDGQSLPGHPKYNLPRSDVTALFPGYANSSGPGAYFDIDTTAYSNGIHTIHWVAVDNAGNADGIGSRYFSIKNSGTAAAGKKGAVFNVQRSMFKVNPGRIPVNYSHPVWIKKGYNTNAEPVTVYPNGEGLITIEIKELERVEIHLFDSTLNVEPRTLNLSSFPIGSSLDMERGIFYWTPGPGFIGTYELVFMVVDSAGNIYRNRVMINIVPK